MCLQNFVCASGYSSHTKSFVTMYAFRSSVHSVHVTGIGAGGEDGAMGSEGGEGGAMGGVGGIAKLETRAQSQHLTGRTDGTSASL